MRLPLAELSRAAHRVAVLASPALVGEALAALLREFGLQATAAADVRAVLAGPAPDVAVVASHGTELTETVARIRTGKGDTRIVVLVGEADADTIAWAERLGVEGLLDGRAPGHELALTVERVVGGHRVVPTTVMVGGDVRGLGLSERQIDVLRLLAEGASNDEIARRLTITVNTVKFHIRTIFSQLGVHNRVEAAGMWASSQERRRLLG